MKLDRVRVGEVLALQRREVVIDLAREYRLIGVYSFGKGIFHRESTAGAALGNFRFFEIKPGDLVLSNIQAWEGAIGYATHIDEGTIGTHRFLSYVPIADRIDADWARWFFLSEPGMELIRRAAPGSTVRNRTLAIDRFEALEIPLPPIANQREVAGRIAVQTEVAAGLRSQSKKRNEITRHLIRSFINETFAGIDSRSLSLGRDIPIISGATPDTSNPLLWDGDIAWITPRDLGPLKTRFISGGARSISRAGLESCSAQIVPAGAVVMSSRAPIGHLAIAAGDLSTNQGCKTFVPVEGMSSDYLYWALAYVMPHIKALGRGTTFHEVSIAKLRGVTIPAPDPDVQEVIVARMSAALEQTQRMQSLLNKAESTVNALDKSVLNAEFAELVAAH